MPWRIRIKGCCGLLPHVCDALYGRTSGRRARPEDRRPAHFLAALRYRNQQRPRWDDDLPYSNTRRHMTIANNGMRELFVALVLACAATAAASDDIVIE
jgi:hypothetical protein